MRNLNFWSKFFILHFWSSQCWGFWGPALNGGDEKNKINIVPSIFMKFWTRNNFDQLDTKSWRREKQNKKKLVKWFKKKIEWREATKWRVRLKNGYWKKVKLETRIKDVYNDWIEVTSESPFRINTWKSQNKNEVGEL